MNQPILLVVLVMMMSIPNHIHSSPLNTKPQVIIEVYPFSTTTTTTNIIKNSHDNKVSTAFAHQNINDDDDDVKQSIIMRTAQGIPYSCSMEKTISPIRKHLDGKCARSPYDRNQYWNQYEVCFFQNVTQLSVQKVAQQTQQPQQQTQTQQPHPPSNDKTIASTFLGSYVRGETVQEFHDPTTDRSVSVSILCAPTTSFTSEKNKLPVIVAVKEMETKRYVIEARHFSACGYQEHSHDHQHHSAHTTTTMTTDHHHAAAAAATTTTTTTTTTTGTTPTHLLSNPLEKLSSHCARRTIGWWTYEVCPFKQVRQYHGSPPDPDNVLGTFNAEATLLAKPRRLHAVQVFTNGSLCNSGSPTTTTRSTRATFRCALDSDTLAIESVDESPLCNYNVRLTSSLLCSVPGFQKSEPERVQIKCERVEH
jgi:hypothetical protein